MGSVSSSRPTARSVCSWSRRRCTARWPCPTDELLLIWHLTDASGGETRPSYFVGTVRELLPGAPFAAHQTETVRDRLQAERRRSSWRAPICPATGPQPCARRTSIIRMTSAYWTRQRKGGAPALVSPHTIDGLYGKHLNLTASRVDTFYSCRFAFFMQYGLRARPRRVARFDALETAPLSTMCSSTRRMRSASRGRRRSGGRAGGARGLPRGRAAVCAGGARRAGNQDRALRYCSGG